MGHLIHIDFGFMLSNSPGGVNFEAAPFKLTRELLEVLDSNAEGRASEMFDYFKVGNRRWVVESCVMKTSSWGKGGGARPEDGNLLCCPLYLQL